MRREPTDEEVEAFLTGAVTAPHAQTHRRRRVRRPPPPFPAPVGSSPLGNADTREPVTVIAVHELVAAGCVLLGDLRDSDRPFGERSLAVTPLGALLVNVLKREPIASVLAEAAAAQPSP